MKITIFFLLSIFFSIFGWSQDELEQDPTELQSDAQPGELSGGNTEPVPLPEEREQSAEVRAEPEPVETASGEGATLSINFGESAKEGQEKICQCKYVSNVPYTTRRKTLGWYIGVQAGAYMPVNYDPAASASAVSNGETYSSYYSGGPSFDLVVAAKLNVLFFSIGPHLSVGNFIAKHEGDSSSAANLAIQPVTAGGILALDGLLGEPYFVPYGIVGVYTAFYNEVAGGTSVSGNTAFAPFYAIGGMFQLDWIDRESKNRTYSEYGLENTFVYVEGRSFLASSTTVPDLSTPLQINGGIRVEF